MKIVAIKFEQPVNLGNYDKNFIKCDDPSVPGLKMFQEGEYIHVTCDALKGEYYEFHKGALAWVKYKHEEKKVKKNND